ncbi:MAG: hypothetical protein FWB79_00690 [Treponema sp.]|nr:hypothetical protein [Treponema sp.]
MVKKIILLFAAALAAGGLAWGQPADPPIPFPDRPPGAWSGRAAVGGFGAVPWQGLSTEARNSATLFRGEADGFIDPRFHDTEIENFLFVSPSSDGRVDIGFARNFGLFYLAVYYGGGIVHATGQNSGENQAAGLPRRGFTAADWNNSLALLVGILGMGIRLDATFDSDTARSVVDYSRIDSPEESRIATERFMGQHGPSLALTWGARFGSLAPWASVGYRFAGSLVQSHRATDFDYENRLSSGAAIAASGGARLDLNDTMAAGAAVSFRNTFPQRESYTGTEPAGREGSLERDFANRRHGMLGFGLDLYYLHRVEINEALELRFRPRLYGGLTIRSNDWEGDTISWTAPGERWTTVAGAIQLGAAFRPNSLLGFFAGVNLELLDWSTWSQIGGDETFPALESSWEIRGVSNGGMGVGVTLTPAENVTLGLGLNGLFMDNHTIDLTASIRFRNRTPPVPVEEPEAGEYDDEEGGTE